MRVPRGCCWRAALGSARPPWPGACCSCSRRRACRSPGSPPASCGPGAPGRLRGRGRLRRPGGSGPRRSSGSAPGGRYGVDLAALERVGLPALGDAGPGGVVVVDELGKMELASAAFRAAVVDLLGRDVAVVATVHQTRDRFTDGLRRRPDIRVIRITEALPETAHNFRLDLIVPVRRSSAAAAPDGPRDPLGVPDAAKVATIPRPWPPGHGRTERCSHDLPLCHGAIPAWMTSEGSRRRREPSDHPGRGSTRRGKPIGSPQFGLLTVGLVGVA
jgi:hypothetical protein